MEISPVSTNSGMAAVTRQLETNMSLQMEVMKTIADGQQQMVDLLQSMGIGQGIDVMA